jgi:hypothetical protein
MERHIKLHEEVPREGDMALEDNLSAMQKSFLRNSAFNGTSNDLSAMQKSFLRDSASMGLRMEQASAMALEFDQFFQ